MAALLRGNPPQVNPTVWQAYSQAPRLRRGKCWKISFVAVDEESAKEKIDTG
jgi:hypothetical protein